MTVTTSMYGPAVDDIPLVGDRLRGLAEGQHPLLGETLAYVFETHGKRIRPTLVLLSGMLGTYYRDRLVTLAASLEVVHTATLVHDDTIDEALTRRGLETVNSVWNSNIAILLGDFLFAQSARLAAELDSVPIMTLLSETVMAMSSGELRQYASSQEHLVDEADYFARIWGKTASLFAMCCEGAAIVSGQHSEQQAALRQYGTNLGLAFQIADDVLDFTGDEHSLGKPAGSDLRQGTITLPAILLADFVPSGSPVLTYLREGIHSGQVVEAVRSSGAADAALSRAFEYAAKARDALAVFDQSEAKRALTDLTDLMVVRRR